MTSHPFKIDAIPCVVKFAGGSEFCYYSGRPIQNRGICHALRHVYSDVHLPSKTANRYRSRVTLDGISLSVIRIDRSLAGQRSLPLCWRRVYRFPPAVSGSDAVRYASSGVADNWCHGALHNLWCGNRSIAAIGVPTGSRRGILRLVRTIWLFVVVYWNKIKKIPLASVVCGLHVQSALQ